MTAEEAWAEERKGLYLTDIAKTLNITRAAVSAWTRVPAEHVIIVAELTGIARERLRPDLYPINPWSTIR